MTTIYPAYTFGGITRPELVVDDTGHIVLFGASAAFAATYGTKLLYVGLPPGFPVLPPVFDSVSTPVDNNAGANSVVEGAAANTAVGVTASATSATGGAVTYSLVGDTSGGGFKVNATTGVVTVNDPTKINFETASHTYTVTVQASDGILTSAQSFVIGVTDVAPTTPVDSNAGANTVAEGATANTAVGITAASSDVNGGAVTYSLTADSSGGGFKIDPITGVVSVADPSKINYESSGAGHSYTITAQASDGTLTSSQTFSIAVTDVPIGSPVDTDATANGVVEGAASGTAVGITASALDPNGPATTYALIGDTSGGGFTINATTGVITVADSTKIDWETLAFNGRDSYTVTVQATNGATVTTQTFSILVSDVAPSTPVDSDGAANTVAEGAANGSTVGVTASSTDVNGPGVTWSLTGDTSGGGFTINSTTGVITVADSTKLDYETASGNAYTVTAQASDGTLATSQTFTIAVTNVNDAPVNGVPGAQAVLEDTNLVFSSANGNAITISDQDGGSGDETVTLTVFAGKLTLGSTANLTSFTNNSDTITLTGSIANINAALNGLSYTPNLNAYGTDQLKVVTNDNGNTGPGGSKTDTDTFNINITPVNDAPEFTVGGTQNVLEDSGAHTVNGFITGIAPGPSNESVPPAQVVDFITTNDNNALFTVQPAIDGSGNLTYTLAANANGSATVTVKAHDDGGTANGGVDTSAAQTFVINAAAVNDAPAGTDNAFTILEDGSHTFTAAEFGFSDPVDAANTSGANTLQSVIITTLPAPAAGILTLDTGGGPVAVTAGQEIPAGQLSGLVFTAAANANGSPEGSFTFQVKDNGGTANGGVDTDQSANTITFNVTAVNDAPAGTDKTISSAGPHTFVAADFGFTDPVDAGSPSGANALQAVIITTIPAVGDGTLTLDTGSGPVAVTAGQVIPVAQIGGLVFTPVANNTGTFTFQVQDNGGTTNSGVDTDQTPNTITLVQNTPPVANDDALSATENGGANNAVAGVNPSGNVILGTGSAGAVQDTDVEDASSALTVVAVGTLAEGNPNNGTVGQDLIGTHGTLHLNLDGSYTYTVDQNDAQVQALHTSANTITDVFHYTIQDTGGLQDTATITFTIHGADDLPVVVADTGTMTEDDAPTSFNVIANDTQDPDSTAANTITLGPGGITVTGPAGETFVNTDATASIVSNQVQVTLVNSHFQQLALGEHTTVTVPYTLTGDAGQTSSANLVVTVNGVNDVPVAVDDSNSMTEDQSGTAFTVLGNDALDADHGAPNNVTVGSVTNLVAPGGENIDLSDIAVSVNGSNQVVVNLGADFQHMKDGESTTFDVAYTLHGDQAGDTSNATLHVTVTGVNDAPAAGNFTFSGTNSAIGNTDLVVNDSTDGAPDPAGPQKTISANILSGASDVDGPGPLIVVAGTIATAQGGTVTMQSDGDFIYKPAVGFSGSDSFTYQVSDQNAGASGVGLGSGTITINVATPKVWYVNAATGSDTTGDGSSEKPFASLAPLSTGGSADALDGANDAIFLYNGTYNSGIVLENGQQLISQSQGLTVNGTTLEAATGSNAVINGTVTLASGNTIDGIDFGNVSGFSLQDSGATVGTATVTDSSISNANGGAVNIANGGTLAMTFSSITASGTSTSAIVLSNTTGNFTANGGTLNNGAAAAADILINGGGSVNFTYDGSVNDTTGTTVQIASQTGGTKDFNGLINGGAISMANNTGATMSFDGGVTLSTGSLNAFTATGGGTVTVTGANNALTTTTGTALNIANTTIGANDVTFKSVSVNGAVNGIVLNNTGTSGGLHVTGTGTSGSGGTIQNTTGQGASFTNSSDVSLAGMNFTNAGTSDLDADNSGLSTGDNLATNAAINLVNVTTATLDTIAISGGAEQGINGNNVANFNLSNSSISNVGNGPDEDGIHFYNMSGTSSITNTTITGSGDDNLNLQNQSGTLDLTISGGSATNAVLGSGYLFGMRNTTVANITLDGVSSTNNFSGGIVADAFDNAVMNLQVTNSTSSGNNDQLSVSAGDNSNVDLDVGGNTLSSVAAGDFVVVSLLGSALDNGYTFDAHIHNNTISVADELAADGIFVFNAGGGVMNTAITNNTITYAGGQRAIIVQQGQDGAATTRATITGNNIDLLINGGNNADNAIVGTSGVADPSGAGSFLDLNIGGTGPLANTITHSLGGTVGAGGDIRVRQRFADNINLDNYAGGAVDTAAVVAYLNSRNNVVDSSSATVDGGSYSGNASPAFITVSVSPSSVLEDGATNLVYTLTRNGSTVSSLVANFAITGTASATSDFTVTGATTFNTGTGLGTVTFAAGSATAVITVNPTADADATEFNESVVLDVGNSSTANGSFAHGIITDDAPLHAAAGGVAAATPAQAASTGEYHLTQVQLDSAVAAAIVQWARAGALPEQLAKLAALTFSVGDLAGNAVGDRSAGHAVIDVDAAGHGWFVDATPSDNFEFAQAANVAGTDLLADPSSAAAGHLDLLTAVMHEMGHELGLDHAADAHDLMFDSLVDGERRLPTAADVGGPGDAEPAIASGFTVQFPAPAVASATTVQPPAPTVVPEVGAAVRGGSDNFVFAHTPVSPAAAQVVGANVILGNQFDFSSLRDAVDHAMPPALHEVAAVLQTLITHSAPHDASAALSALAHVLHLDLHL